MYTKDTQFADWLCWFTDEDKLSRPFLLPNGSRAATDSKIAVVVNDGGQTFEIEARLTRLRKVPDYIVGFLSGEAISSKDFQANELRGLLGECEHPEVETCARCKGTKRTAHDCNCEYCEKTETCWDCDGAGNTESTPEIRYVTFFGHPFDANRSAYILAHAPETERVQVRLSKEKDSHLLHLITDKWHAILVELTRDSLERVRDEDKQVPELAAVPVGREP